MKGYSRPECPAAPGLFSRPPCSVLEKQGTSRSGLSASCASSLHPQLLVPQESIPLGSASGLVLVCVARGHTGSARPVQVSGHPLTWLLATGGLQSRRVMVLVYLPLWLLGWVLATKGKGVWFSFYRRKDSCLCLTAFTVSCIR